MPEEDSPAFPNPEDREQTPELTMDQLPSELGFSETPQMLQIKEPLVKAFADTQNRELLYTLLSQYHELAEELIDQHPDTDKSKLDLGYALTMALMRRDALRLQDYIDDLEEVWLATTKKLSEFQFLVPVLREELKRATAELDAKQSSD